MTIDVPVVLIRPTRLYRPDMSPDELHEATRGVWRVDPARAGRCRFALAVVSGEVVEAYKIDHWQPAGTAEYRYRPRQEIERPGRFEFIGRRAGPDGQRYVGASVHEHFKKGNQNPIRYLNCD